jgi:hypothetical protein
MCIGHRFPVDLQICTLNVAIIPQNQILIHNKFMMTWHLRLFCMNKQFFLNGSGHFLAMKGMCCSVMHSCSTLLSKFFSQVLLRNVQLVFIFRSL